MSSSRLDPDLINTIRELQIEGEPDILSALAKLFIETMAGPAESLLEAAATTNMEALSRNAHMLKSGSANVGALRLSEISEALEAIGEGKDPSELANLASQFQTEFASVIQELEALLS